MKKIIDFFGGKAGREADVYPALKRRQGIEDTERMNDIIEAMEPDVKKLSESLKMQQELAQWLADEILDVTNARDFVHLQLLHDNFDLIPEPLHSDIEIARDAILLKEQRRNSAA